MAATWVEATSPASVWRWGFELLFASAISKESDLGYALKRSLSKLRDFRESTKPSAKLLDAVTGIEVMFSEGGNGICEKIADRIAVLLAQSSLERPAYIELVRRTYERRSALSHGRTSECSEEDVRLAAVLHVESLRGLLHWGEARRNMGEDVRNLRDRPNVLKLLDNEIRTTGQRLFEFVPCRWLQKAAGIEGT